jgi:hypothetical protein
MTARGFHARSAAELRLAAWMLTNAARHAEHPSTHADAVALMAQAAGLIASAYGPALPEDDRQAAWARLLRDSASL